MQKRNDSKGLRDVFINILEIDKPEIDAQLVAESIATQLLKRIAFRRAMRKAVESALRFGAKGVKVRVSGRLGHLSNREAAGVLRETVGRNCKAVVLAHLSEQNNTPALALEAAADAVNSAAGERLEMLVAAVDSVTPAVRL